MSLTCRRNNLAYASSVPERLNCDSNPALTCRSATHYPPCSQREKIVDPRLQADMQGSVLTYEIYDSQMDVGSAPGSH